MLRGYYSQPHPGHFSLSESGCEQFLRNSSLLQRSHNTKTGHTKCIIRRMIVGVPCPLYLKDSAGIRLYFVGAKMLSRVRRNPVLLPESLIVFCPFGALKQVSPGSFFRCCVIQKITCLFS